MGIGGSLQALGRFIDACEQQRHVKRVALSDDWSQGAAGTLTADVELSLSAHSSADGSEPLSFGGASIDGDGAIRLTFETVDAVLPEREDGLELEPVDAAFSPDGTVAVTLTASMQPDGADDGSSRRPDGGPGARTDDRSSTRSIGDPTTRPDGDDATRSDAEPPSQPSSESGSLMARESATPEGEPDELPSTETETVGATGSRRSRDVPPFRDRDLLREVYESCETFAEMPDALGMEVTAETVRRYMIDYGIHEPSTYDTSGDDEGEPSEDDAELEPPVVVADGVGLPDDLTVDALVETVRRSNTIYEVQTDIGIEREDALALLKQLDLVGHVVGRLATEDEREVSRELVVERLRQQTEQPGARHGD